MSDYTDDPIPAEFHESEQVSIAEVFRVMFRPGAVFPRLIRTGHAWPWAFVLISLAAVFNLLVGLETIQAEIQENLPTALGTDIDPQVYVAIMLVVSIFAIPFGYMISLLFTAGVFLFFGNFVLGGKANFKQVLNISAFSMSPLILAQLLSALIYMLSGFPGFRMSPDMLLSEEMRTSFIGLWLGTFDFFYIWQIVLLVFGLARLYGFSRGKTAAWLVSLLLAWHTFWAMALAFAADFVSSMGSQL